MKRIVVIVGPTASGKTALSIEVAKQFGGEIVSGDSMQIYKLMDIGTAKPTVEERQGIPHHMIDFLPPEQKYDVASFVRDARGCIDDIHRRGKLPVLVGGTGLYIDHVVKDTEFEKTDTDAAYRAELEKIAQERGNEYLHRLLAEIDPQAAEKIHPNNVRRVIRAMEVFQTTGKTFTQCNLESIKAPVYDAVWFGLNMPRELLYDRINRRVDLMMERGLLDEVKTLRALGVSTQSTAMQAIGYKELLRYLDGECALEEAVELIKQESRRYAKRQLTWFKRNPDIHWLMLQNDYSFTTSCTQCFSILKSLL